MGAQFGSSIDPIQSGILFFFGRGRGWPSDAPDYTLGSKDLQGNPKPQVFPDRTETGPGSRSGNSFKNIFGSGRVGEFHFGSVRVGVFFTGV